MTTKITISIISYEAGNMHYHERQHNAHHKQQLNSSELSAIPHLAAEG
jgi:mannose/fructose/N-acetylgalactosamine-specific phosphotransferase system component IIB